MKTTATQVNYLQNVVDGLLSLNALVYVHS